MKITRCIKISEVKKNSVVETTYFYYKGMWSCIVEEYGDEQGYSSDILYGLEKRIIKNNLKAVDNKTVFKEENIFVNLEGSIFQD